MGTIVTALLLNTEFSVEYLRLTKHANKGHLFLWRAGFSNSGHA